MWKIRKHFEELDLHFHETQKCVEPKNSANNKKKKSEKPLNSTLRFPLSLVCKHLIRCTFWAVGTCTGAGKYQTYKGVYTLILDWTSQAGKTFESYSFKLIIFDATWHQSTLVTMISHFAFRLPSESAHSNPHKVMCSCRL